MGIRSPSSSFPAEPSDQSVEASDIESNATVTEKGHQAAYRSEANGQDELILAAFEEAAEMPDNRK